MNINLFFNYIKSREKEKKNRKPNKINLYVRILLFNDIRLEYFCRIDYITQIDSADDRKLIGNKKGTYGQSIDKSF